MENEAKATNSKVWLIPTIVAVVAVVALIAFMVILGKGTAAVSNGTQTLAESVAPLQDGTAQLADGVKAYTEGVDTMNDAMPTLEDGVTQYTEGVDQLNGFMKQLNAAAPELAGGVKQLTDGANALNKGVNGEGQNLSNGIAALAAGLPTLYDGLANDTSATSGVMGALNALYDGANALKVGSAAGIQQAFDAVAAGAKDSADKMAAQEKGMMFEGKDAQYIILASSVMATGADATKVQQAAGEVLTAGSANAFTALCGDFGTNNKEITATLAALNVAYANLEAGTQKDALGAALQQMTAGAVGAATAVGADGQFKAGLQQATQVVGSITVYAVGYHTAQAGLAGMKTGTDLAAKTVNDGLAPNFDTLIAGIDGLRTVVKGQLLPGVKTAMDGAAALNAGVNGNPGSDLATGLKALTDGLNTLNKSVNGKDGLVSSVKKLYAEGSNKLAENSQALRDGVKQLSDGAKQLSDNSAALRDGANSLKDAAPALIDGIGQLVDGAKQVNGFTPIHN